MIERKRNIEHLNDEQVGLLQTKLNAKLLEILERASKEANDLMNPYGIEVKVGFVAKEQKAKRTKKTSKS